MANIDITISIPEELWDEAQELGLLTSANVAALLRNEVDRQVMDIVNTEIQAYRAEKNNQNFRPDSNDPRRS